MLYTGSCNLQSQILQVTMPVCLYKFSHISLARGYLYTASGVHLISESNTHMKFKRFLSFTIYWQVVDPLDFMHLQSSWSNYVVLFFVLCCHSDNLKLQTALLFLLIPPYAIT